MAAVRPTPCGGGTDRQAWHESYRDQHSPLSRRLRITQAHITRWLDARPGEAVRVVSACAGQGDDLIGVLARRADAHRVRATLLETDDRNLRAARAAAARAGLNTVEVHNADAADLASHRTAAPADLVLTVAVFANISDHDIQTTIAALPQLCRPTATVIWTRTRRAPDLTGSIRAWFAAAGFTELTFTAPEDVLISVGVHRLDQTPPPLAATGRLFEFIV